MEFPEPTRTLLAAKKAKGLSFSDLEMVGKREKGCP